MAPRLVDHLTQSLDPKLLVEPVFRHAPQKTNSWAFYCAWVVDWVFAIAAAKLATSSWMDFVGPLGLSKLPGNATELISQYQTLATLVLAPLFFFTMSFFGVLFQSKTLGMRLFSHRVEAHTLNEAVLWAWTSTVSAVLLGYPLLTEWLDQVAMTSTSSDRYQHWLYSRPVFQLEPAPVNVLLEAEAEAQVVDDEDYSEAA
jgi:hypothetical protein